MNRNRNAVDGFVTPGRRRNPGVINANYNAQRPAAKSPASPYAPNSRFSAPASGNQMDFRAPRPVDNLTKNPAAVVDPDVKNSLNAIDKKTPKPKKELNARHTKKLAKINNRRRLKNKTPLTPKKYRQRLWMKRVGWVVAAVLAIVIIFQGYRILSSLSKIVKGNVFSIINKKKLKQDEFDRTNILIFGTSPEGWEGADLADSIMVISYNQEKGDMFTISLPRDLYVKHQCSGWLGTTAGKLNESYGCGKASVNGSDQEAEAAGRSAMASAANAVLGLDIHYQIHANWRVLTEVVDVIGGIDVTIEAYDGSSEVYDVATKVRYKNGEQVHLNGERALALSRARGSAGGYGFSGGNFDRERNQQKIFKAIVSKIKSSNKADFNTLTNIIESLGNNISTNFEAGELQSVADLAQKYDSNNTKPVLLVDNENGVNLLQTDNVAGASVVVPTEGTFEYGNIKRYIRKNLSADEVTKEDAKIVVLNGTTISGLAGKHKTKLTDKDLNVVEVGTAQLQNYQTTTIYVLNPEKKATAKKLSEIYQTTPAADTPDFVKNYQADIVVVLGSNSGE